MAKFGFFEDTFEKALEAGTTIAKQSGKQVAQTINPLKILEKATGSQSPLPAEASAKAGQSPQSPESPQSKKGNHTKLDFQKLQNNYQNQDKAKTDALRNRLFQMVKGADEKILMQKRQEEIEKKRKEEYEGMEKKRREEEKKKQQTMQGAPKGKIRRFIFSPKKVAKREQAEVKPSAGKQ